MKCIRSPVIIKWGVDNFDVSKFDKVDVSIVRFICKKLTDVAQAFQNGTFLFVR